MISIITPTIGRDVFQETLESINQQTVSCDIHHYIVIDNAPENLSKVERVLEKVICAPNVKRFIISLPFCSGKNKYNGHKIYASIPQFIETEYLCFFDDDNIMMPDHLETCLRTLRKGDLDWCYTLRTCFDTENEIDDNGESLGHLQNILLHPENYLIDTNLYFVKTNIAQNVCFVWNGRCNYDLNDPDRLFAKTLMANFQKYDCTMKKTVKYRLNWGQMNWFVRCNKSYKNTFDWDYLKKPILYIVHFDAEQTFKILDRIYFKKSNDSVCFKQWNLNFFDRLKDHFFLKSAYHSPYIPSGSNVLVHMCFPNKLPSLLERKDINKILFTYESPNIRHQQQWSKQFLEKYFTRVITYWDDLKLDIPVDYFPFIHRLDMENENDMNFICDNEDKGISACICLENRPFNDYYEINGVRLKAQDNMRKVVVCQMSKLMPVYCYGESWNESDFSQYRNVKCIKTPNRFLDADTPIDYYKKHQFTIIIENCNARGYVSEKLYDALMVGSIPVYMGNIDNKLKFFFDDIPILDMIVPIEEIYKIKNPAFVKSRIDNIQKYKMELLSRVSVTNYANFMNQYISRMPLKFYSQCGEDRHIYHRYFKDCDIKDGVFFEAGAMCGKQWSNTKFFEDYLGWKGVLVEPNPVQYQKLVLNRGGLQNKLFHCLISDSKEGLDFKYSENQHCAVSSVVSTMPKGHEETYFSQVNATHVKIEKIRTKSLTDILKESGFEKIDFFSLDVEGHELNVLKSFDFSIPISLFMIENLENNENDGECGRILRENGFIFVEKFHINDIYIHQDSYLNFRKRND